jgi:uncharacterized membrane protein YhaH (DUF805 family)
MKSKLAENTHRFSEVDLLSTQGRIGRKLYFLYSSLIPLLILAMVLGAAGMLEKLNMIGTVAIYALLAFAIIFGLYSMIHLTIKRCQDFNANHWLAGLSIIPFANIIFSLFLGDSGLNQYGEAPQSDRSLANIAIALLICISGIIVALFFYNGFNLL